MRGTWDIAVTLQRIPDYPCEVECAKATACYAYKKKQSGRQVLMFWDKSAVPSNGNEAVSPILTTSKSELKEPVRVDTITGGMYELPMERMIVEGEKLVFKDVPVYDAPTLIADKSLLMP